MQAGKALKKAEAAPLEKVPAEYLRRARELAGYSGIFIAAPRDKWPTTFGVSSDPKNAYGSIQRGYWEEQFIFVFLLTPGPPVANRIKVRMQENLSSKRQFHNPNWYNASVEEVEKELQWAADAEGVELFDEIEAHRRYILAVQKALEESAGLKSLAPPPTNVVRMSPSPFRKK